MPDWPGLRGATAVPGAFGVLPEDLHRHQVAAGAREVSVAVADEPSPANRSQYWRRRLPLFVLVT